MGAKDNVRVLFVARGYLYISTNGGEGSGILGKKDLSSKLISKTNLTFQEIERLIRNLIEYLLCTVGLTLLSTISHWIAPVQAFGTVPLSVL